MPGTSCLLIFGVLRCPLQVGHEQQLGLLPVGLIPLPASRLSLPASGPPPLALALSERPFVVKRQPGGVISRGDGADEPAPDSSSSGGTSGGDRFPAQGLPSAEALCAPRLTRAALLTLPGDEPRCERHRNLLRLSQRSTCFLPTVELRAALLIRHKSQARLSSWICVFLMDMCKLFQEASAGQRQGRSGAAAGSWLGT